MRCCCTFEPPGLRGVPALQCGRCWRGDHEGCHDVRSVLHAPLPPPTPITLRPDPHDEGMNEVVRALLVVLAILVAFGAGCVVADLLS